MNDWIARDLKHNWHPYTQMKDCGRLPPIFIEKARGLKLYADRRTLVLRHDLQLVVQRPRAQPPAHPRGDPQADRLARPRPLRRVHAQAGHPPGREAHGPRAARADEALLLRQRLDRRRGRAEDVLPVLAERRPAGKAPVRRAGSGLPRRHGRRDERQRRQPVQRAVRAAPVPGVQGAVPLLLPLPGGTGTAELRDRVRAAAGTAPPEARRGNRRNHPRAAGPGGGRDDHLPAGVSRQRGKAGEEARRPPHPG